MTLLYRDALFLKHDTGQHPENADRLRAIIRRLENAGLDKRCEAGSYEPLTEQAVTKIHTPGLFEAVKQVSAHGGGRLDPDTVLSADSFAVAVAAAGACSAAVDAIVAGKAKNALCLVRPPGHHATPSRAMGFCLFNNIALAAQRARDAHQLERVLIVDFDVHHGNGTQDIFYEDAGVVFASIHRYGMGFYPGTGAADETGRGKGLGCTFNAPLRFGTSRKEFREAFASLLEKAADKSKPQLVLLSAGFDAHARDPVGSLGLESEDFATLTQLVLQVADTHAGGRLVSCLEGGYHLDALAESVQAHLEELLTSDL